MQHLKSQTHFRRDKFGLLTKAGKGVTSLTLRDKQNHPNNPYPSLNS